MVERIKEKWKLYLGAIIILVALVLRIYFPEVQIINPMFFIGGGLKVWFLVGKIKDGGYKPGVELILLLIGLTMFFSGVYGRNHDWSFSAYWLIIPGALFKLVFVFLFIRKLALNKVKANK